MYSHFNERSELERFRNNYTETELDNMVDRYESIWRPYFREEMSKEVPRHPWKVLKEARADYAETENDGDWPEMPKRHALRVVKDEFVEKWEAYRQSI